MGSILAVAGLRRFHNDQFSTHPGGSTATYPSPVTAEALSGVCAALDKYNPSSIFAAGFHDDPAFR
jgi:hypothetical protein